MPDTISEGVAHRILYKLGNIEAQLDTMSATDAVTATRLKAAEDAIGAMQRQGAYRTGAMAVITAVGGWIAARLHFADFT